MNALLQKILDRMLVMLATSRIASFCPVAFDSISVRIFSADDCKLMKIRFPFQKFLLGTFLTFPQLIYPPALRKHATIEDSWCFARAGLERLATG